MIVLSAGISRYLRLPEWLARDAYQALALCRSAVLGRAAQTKIQTLRCLDGHLNSILIASESVREAAAAAGPHFKLALTLEALRLRLTFK